MFRSRRLLRTSPKLPKHAIETLENKMVRNPSNDFCDLLLDLVLWNSRFGCRLDRKSKHGQHGERDLGLMLCVRSR